MHGDFSLDPRRHGDRISRVLYQMGRVQLDSDFNEQTETHLRALRDLGTDVIGAHAGLGNSFKIVPGPDASKPNEFAITWGHYWVDGILCENLPKDADWLELAAEADPKKFGPGLPVLEHADSFWDAKRERKDKDLLYLAVWERHISASEDDTIREVALGGPDTTSRAVIVWQIRSMPSSIIDTIVKRLPKDAPPFDPVYLALNIALRPRGRMRAKAEENTETDACTISPEARYRGEENRLYRVEIHEIENPKDNKPATFKWAPDNGSIVYPIKKIEGTTVFLESLGRDERTAITTNDWVEVVDDEIALRRIANPLLQVMKVDRQRRTVELSAEPANKAGSDPDRNPILRRWSEASRPIEEVAPDEMKAGWKELSDGIEIQFSRAPQPAEAPAWRTGDHWFIPARAATGGIIWPGGVTNPGAVLPHGIDEHYAPLATLTANATGASAFPDARFTFDPIRKKVP
jgi:hypothetical protein